MTSKKGYIIRGDDGKLYRVSHAEMHAHPLKPDDPAMKHAKEMHDLAKNAGASHPMVCIIVRPDTEAKQ